MNPFLHPAVATPLEPDDVPLWRPGPIDPTPEHGDDEAASAPSHAGGHDGKVSGTMRVSIPRHDGLRGTCLFPGRPDRHGKRRGAHGMERSSACLPALQPHAVWQGRLLSLVLAAALGLGVCGPAAAQPAQVNANVATVAELETIKGISPKTARNIVSERQRSGLFESFQDFSERIRGIGAKRAASLRAAGLVIGPPTHQPQAAAPAGPGHGTGDAPVGVLVR